MRRNLQEAAMGVSGQGEKSLSPKTQKNVNDNAIRKIVSTLLVAVLIVSQVKKVAPVLHHQLLWRMGCRFIIP